MFAFAHEGEILFFSDSKTLLASEAFIKSLQPGFVLSDDASAEVFELALDTIADFDRSDKARFERNGQWIFIRNDFFDDGMGFIVHVDENNRITKVEYSLEIPLEGVEVPIEIPFDESTVTWTFTLVEPTSSSIQIPEAENISVTLEFNDWAATQLGAWIGTFWQGELVSMYASTNMSSPHHASIPAEVLSPGENLIIYKFLRPGHDFDNPLTESIELSIWVGE